MWRFTDLGYIASRVSWLLTVVFLSALIALPVGNHAQFTLAIATFAAMVLLWRFRSSSTLRLGFMLLGCVVVLRYLYWRTTSTLPPISDLAGFIPGMILYIAELYCIAMMFISLVVVVDPVQRKTPAISPETDNLPSVDVFVPSYNERIDLLSTTLAAAKSMTYPADKLTIYLLDDGGTDQKCNQVDPIAATAAQERRAELQQLCRKLDVVYIARALNEHAKAGNLNAGLARSSGDLIAVFDADHAPVREFLLETVGHFLSDPRLFLVQTPHFFLNPDPIEKNLSTFMRMPSENEMFYGVIQRGLDKWNAAFFCGSAALLRRAALTESNGFSGVTITEDCETALELHSRGWNSRYVDKPLIAGLQPETFDIFIGQRSRWCRGMIQILMLKNPLLKRGLTAAQRLCYLSTALFWLFPLPRLIFMIAPLFYLFFGVKLFVANIDEFISYTATYLCISLMMQNYLYGQVRWPWISELYEYAQSFFLARAILSVVTNPRKPTFNVTAKGMTLDQDHLSSLAKPYFVMFAILLAGVGMTIWRYMSQPATSDLTLFVGGWNVFNLVIAGAGLGVVIERRERRRSQRLAISRPGTLSVGNQDIRVLADDASMGGIRVRPFGSHHLPANLNDSLVSFAVDTNDSKRTTPKVLMQVRRVASDTKGTFIGLEYTSLETTHYQMVADLMFADAAPLENFRSVRRSGKGILSGTLQFMGWSLRETARCLGFIIRNAVRDSVEPPQVVASRPEAASPVVSIINRSEQAA